VTPTVRSRLWASIISFALGFGIANYGVLVIGGPDRWLWVAVAVVLMLTGAGGVLLADTTRPVSFWSVLGIELLVVFAAVPLLWTFTVATAPGGVTPRDLWPHDLTWSAFDGAIHSETLRDAAVTSLLVAALATAIAMPLAAAAAYALVHLRVRGRRVVYGFVVASLLMPVVAIVGPFQGQLVAFDLYGSRLALVVPTLVITLPLAIWLTVTLFRDVPWGLLDAVRADGATRTQVVRLFVLPQLGAGLVVVTVLVFVAACNDFVIGAGLGASDVPLPATLMLATGRADDPGAAIAAGGLLWLLLPLALLLVAPRRINHLLGRSYR
jgi:multiple sugar transport system permease protein